MSKKNLATGTSPFAHLLAGFRGTRAEESKPDDEEGRKARRAEEDKQREEENARRAEEDDRRNEEDARRAEEDGGEDSKPAEGKRAEDDEQDPEADSDDDTAAEEDMDEKEAKAFRRGLALGRLRENARGGRIFGHVAAAGRPDLAATLAFTTRNTSAEAGRLMAVAGPGSNGARRSIDQRMATVTIPNPGAGGSGGSGKPDKLSEVDEFVAAAKVAAEKAGIR